MVCPVSAKISPLSFITKNPDGDTTRVTNDPYQSIRQRLHDTRRNPASLLSPRLRLRIGHGNQHNQLLRRRLSGHHRLLKTPPPPTQTKSSSTPANALPHPRHRPRTVGPRQWENRLGLPSSKRLPIPSASSGSTGSRRHRRNRIGISQTSGLRRRECQLCPI